MKSARAYDSRTWWKISFDDFSSKIGYNAQPDQPVSVGKNPVADQSEGGIIEGAGEALQSVGANVLGAVGSGLGGIYELIRTGDIDQAANAVRSMQQSIADRFAPETQTGEQILEGGMQLADAAGRRGVRERVPGWQSLAGELRCPGGRRSGGGRPEGASGTTNT